MKALVLAAGKGKRLRPLTDETPKPILEAGGRPLIHYALMMLRRAGIAAAVINVHHLAGRIEAALGDGSRLGIKITYSPEPVLLGTGGALSVLRGAFDDGPFCVVNSDSISDLDLSAMIAAHDDHSALMTLALLEPGSSAPYSRIEADGDLRIQRIERLVSRKPERWLEYEAAGASASASKLNSFMYCGVMVADPAVFDMMPKQPPWDLIADLAAPMVVRGRPIFGFVHRGYFRTVDDLEGYEALKKELAVSPPPSSCLE